MLYDDFKAAADVVVAFTLELLCQKYVAGHNGTYLQPIVSLFFHVRQFSLQVLILVPCRLAHLLTAD